ncbi:MAG: hypothetical protein M3151_04850 [Actinomycetota bacterium]|nr:hypothetical protein [Actinomycetota bacterium]
MLDKVLVAIPSVDPSTRVPISVVAARTPVGTSIVPVVVVATRVPVTAPVAWISAFFVAVLRDELAEGVFGAFVEAPIGSVGVAVLDPGSRRFGRSAIRIAPLCEGSLARSLLLLFAGSAYKGSRDDPGEDQKG